MGDSTVKLYDHLAAYKNLLAITLLSASTISVRDYLIKTIKELTELMMKLETGSMTLVGIDWGDDSLNSVIKDLRIADNHGVDYLNEPTPIEYLKKAVDKLRQPTPVPELIPLKVFQDVAYGNISRTNPMRDKFVMCGNDGGKTYNRNEKLIDIITDHIKISREAVRNILSARNEIHFPIRAVVYECLKQRGVQLCSSVSVDKDADAIYFANEAIDEIMRLVSQDLKK